MHFSIPDTTDLTDANGSSYTVFNIHVNGAYHCSVRYSQLHEFHLKLKKEYVNLPAFPPKKIFPLSVTQLDERRLELEHFIQQVSQVPEIVSSTKFKAFLLTAQQESVHETPQEVNMDIFMADGGKVTTYIKSTDKTEDVLKAVSAKIGLPDQYINHFGLYLVSTESGSDYSIVRKLQEFESPYISVSAVKGTAAHWIMLRKAYWDSNLDIELMEDRIAINLLYVQAVSDIERGWIAASCEQSSHLAALRERGSTKEFLHFVRTLKYYGYIIFKSCKTDYPKPDTCALVACGNNELNIRVQCQAAEVKEVSFRITRIRCWRISSVVMEPSDIDVSHGSAYRLELAFEYLVAKNTLKWITIYSSQAILISMCLQGMVDELVKKKEGQKSKQEKSSSGRIPQRLHCVGGAGLMENDAFGGIRDDDL